MICLARMQYVCATESTMRFLKELENLEKFRLVSTGVFKETVTWIAVIRGTATMEVTLTL